MAKLTRVINAAQRAGLMKRSVAKNLWMTEMSWDSFPDPNGLSLADQALYMQGAFYVLWKAGVQHVLWWNFRDQQKGADWNASLQSGVYMLGAKPERARPGRRQAESHRLPLPVHRLPPARRRGALGAAARHRPRGGAGAERHHVAQGDDAQGAPGRRGERTPAVNPGATLRAVQGGEISLTWRTF